MKKNTIKTNVKKRDIKVPFFFKITLIITLVVALIGGGLVYVASEQFR